MSYRILLRLRRQATLGHFDVATHDIVIVAGRSQQKEATVVRHSLILRLGDWALAPVAGSKTVA